MFERFSAKVLAWLRVPAEPHPPQGDPASLRVFRAGRNYYRLRMAQWGLAQAIALAGIVFWTTVLLEVEQIAHSEQTMPPAAPPGGGATAKPASEPTRQQRIDAWRAQFIQHLKETQKQHKSRLPIVAGWEGAKRGAVEVALLLPPWAFPLIWGLKIFGFAVYLAQLAITYVTRRLDYELRWYLVTDRSLRLRHGVWVVWETTMSFANIQQVTVSQGPLQRVLGLANVKVDSAGGGTGQKGQPGEDMHVGYFHSVTNADEIRDLIQDRLRHFRESGLGDPEEKPTALPARSAPASSAPTSSRDTELLLAARDLAAEARALRTAITPR